ncbi:MAG: polysaccharide deacetylase family protein [Chloroflexota bacterium]
MWVEWMYGAVQPTFPLVHPLLWGRQALTVLAYHRIGEPERPSFDTYKPNVSATPAAFAEQMAFVQSRFNVIGLAEVVAWLEEGRPLPPRPLLITFDDGYQDNYDYAWPILRQRNLPAVIFLATDYIDNDRPFFWDLVAYCFHHTRLERATLPLVGRQEWGDAVTRTAVMENWLRALKGVRDDLKWEAVGQAPKQLEVYVPDGAFAGLCLTWEEVRAMAAGGMSMGAHTRSHAILRRVGEERVREEIAGSKERIEAETGRPVTAFAYPNGQPGDFDEAHGRILGEVGVKVAFTLRPGPARLAEVQRSPLTIRRVFVGYRDSLPRFVAKVLGLPRLVGRP